MNLPSSRTTPDSMRIPSALLCSLLIISSAPAESITLTAERRPSRRSAAVSSLTITLNAGDLATTQPGLFTTTNTNRFFRVRMTRVPEP